MRGMGQWRKMGWKRGKWGGKWEGNGEIVGIAHGMWVVEGCGGMWLRKMGGTWEKNGTKQSFFAVPFSPFFPGSKMFPTIPFVKNQLTALTDRKVGIFATHRHSAPRRPVQMLESSTHDAAQPSGIRLLQIGGQALPHTNMARKLQQNTVLSKRCQVHRQRKIGPEVPPSCTYGEQVITLRSLTVMNSDTGRDNLDKSTTTSVNSHALISPRMLQIRCITLIANETDRADRKEGFSLCEPQRPPQTLQPHVLQLLRSLYNPL